MAVTATFLINLLGKMSINFARIFLPLPMVIS
jgi:hypothetical protein